MAQGNNDDLANLLSGMMNGDHPQEQDPQHEQETPPSPAPARPAAPTPAPTARPAAPKPRAADPKPAPSRPATPAPVARPAAPAPISRPATPPPAPVEPVLAEPVAEEPADVAAEQAMEPAAEEETYADETITQAYGHDTVDAADDAVIVPPPTSDMLAHTHAPKRPMRQQSMVQKLAFKQTIIPIMLTVGLICLIVVGMGLVAGEESPFKVFRMMGFAVPVALIGLTLLALGVLTMLQVKNELDKHKQAEKAAAATPH